jgi:pseudouridine-5'-phosphate glycosidase/pseudouridine kinase
LIRSENPDIIDTDIVVLGSIALDLSCDYTPKGKGPGDITYSKKKTFDVVPEMHTSNIATITQSVGGVGHNVALAAHRAGSGLTIRLHSAVADDL